MKSSKRNKNRNDCSNSLRDTYVQFKVPAKPDLTTMSRHRGNYLNHFEPFTIYIVLYNCIASCWEFTSQLDTPCFLWSSDLIAAAKTVCKKMLEILSHLSEWTKAVANSNPGFIYGVETAIEKPSSLKSHRVIWKKLWSWNLESGMSSYRIHLRIWNPLHFFLFQKWMQSIFVINVVRFLPIIVVKIERMFVHLCRFSWLAAYHDCGMD